MLNANPVAKIIAVRTAQASALALAVHWLLHWPLTGPRALGLFLTPALCLYFVFVFVAPWTWGLPIRTRLPARNPTEERAVALTFDDGPTPETTPAILDTLARHGVHGTFFVLGENVRRHPDIAARIVAEGHAIGIHGFRHIPFVLLSAAQVREEIARTRAACPQGPGLTWLRPPHGFKTLALPWLARKHGCRLVTWSVNAGDYRTRDADVVAATALKAVRPGAIVLLHDGACNGATVAALPLILDGLAGRGYQCVTL